MHSLDFIWFYNIKMFQTEVNTKISIERFHAASYYECTHKGDCPGYFWD